jgi:phosphotransferase system HPr (HPr) family protein
MVVVRYNARVIHESGLHAAKSAQLVQGLSSYTGEFQLIVGNKIVDMKSILGLMSLALHEAVDVELRVAVASYNVLASVESVLVQHFELSERQELLNQ